MQALARAGLRVICRVVLAASVACGGGDGKAVDAVDAGPPGLPLGGDAAAHVVVDAAHAMAACRAEHSHAECLIRAIARYFEAASCDGSPLSVYVPSERECFVEAYSKVNEETV